MTLCEGWAVRALFNDGLPENQLAVMFTQHLGPCLKLIHRTRV